MTPRPRQKVDLTYWDVRAFAAFLLAFMCWILLDFGGWPERRMHPTQPLDKSGSIPVVNGCQEAGSSRQLRSQQEGHETGSCGLHLCAGMWNGASYNTPKMYKEPPPSDFDDEPAPPPATTTTHHLS